MTSLFTSFWFLTKYWCIDQGSIFFIPNHEILSTFLTNNSVRRSPANIIYVCKLYAKYNMNPNEKAIKTLEHFKQRMLKIEKEVESRKDEKYNNKYYQDLVKEFHVFLKFYNVWLKKSKMDKTPHPWQAYSRGR